jgi:hypothetical protein
MQGEMPKRRGHLPSRPSILDTLVGRGLPERMRSASVALLGVTAAISMAFVAVIAHQGWSVFPLGPIPGLPAGPQGVGEGTALGPGPGAGPAQVRPATLAESPSVAQAAPAARPGARRAGGTISGSQALALAPAGQPPAGEPSPAGTEPAPPAGTGAPASQPGSAGSSPTTASPGPRSSEPGRSTAAVKQQEADQEREEEEAAQAGSGQPPEASSENAQQVADEEAEEAASAPSWSGSHGHGWGHHHG